MNAEGAGSRKPAGEAGLFLAWVETRRVLEVGPSRERMCASLSEWMHSGIG